MILDDLFEMKPSDLPTYLRRQQGRPDLTMKDIEAERPQGAYRYRVGEKEFMDLAAAQEFAKGTGQRVTPITAPRGNPRAKLPVAEQEIDINPSMSLETRGRMVLAALEKDQEFARMSRRPIRINLGGEQFIIQDPDIKNRILTMAKTYNKKGSLPQFLLNLGQPDSLHFLLGQLEKQSDVGVGGQAGLPRSPRYVGEKTEAVKKKTDREAGDIVDPGTSTRTQRILQQIRARQPQASSDVEALIYDIRDQRRQDQEEIDRLEKDVSDLEQDIKKDLRTTVRQLRGRKGGNVELLRQIQSTDKEQSDAIQKILQIDRSQQDAINDLEQKTKTAGEKKVQAIATRPVTAPAVGAATPAAPATSIEPTAATLPRPPARGPITIPTAIAAPTPSARVGKTGELFVEPETPTVKTKPQEPKAKGKVVKGRFPKKKNQELDLEPDQMVAEYATTGYAVKVSRSGANETPVMA